MNNNIYRTNFNYIENRGDKSPPEKNKFNFNNFKKDTITSLNDVEQFLNDFQSFWKYVKLYKILK